MGVQRRLVLPILGALLLLIVGCSSSEPTLVGSWEGVSGPGVADRLQFFDDGTVSVIQDGDTIDGTYEVLGSSRIRIALAFDYTFTVEVSRRELTMTRDGEEFVYRRQ